MITRRLYFALWPDNRQRDRLRDVINSVARTVEGKAVDRRDWHVTLVYVGDIDERLVERLQEAVSEIQVQPFRLGFDRLEYWARTRVGCLLAPTVPPELQNLVDELNSALQRAAILPEDRIYRPHITVSKAARAFPTERLAQRAVTEWSSFELIESVPGPGGTRYVPLKQ